MNQKSNTQNDTLDVPTINSDWRSVGLSLVFHVLLLVLLVLFFTNSPGVAEGESLRSVDIVLAVEDSGDDSVEFQTQPEAESDVTNSSQAEQLEALPEVQPPTMPDVMASELPGFEMSPDLNVDATQMTTTNPNNNRNEKYELTQEDLKFIAREQAELRRRMPKGEPVDLQIFGSQKLTGRRFVFVLDRSRSMGDSGLGVLDRARGELSAALEDLGPEHQFQVIAYHQSTVMIGKRQMLAATKSNKLRVPTFIQTLAAFGATRHENGLTAALAFRPDVVVFMTDGGLPALNDGQIATLLKVSGGKTEIHCLQFGSGVNQERNNFMMRLARRSNGSYRYLNVNDWSP